MCITHIVLYSACYEKDNKSCYAPSWRQRDSLLTDGEATSTWFHVPLSAIKLVLDVVYNIYKYEVMIQVHNVHLA